ncbi:MAG: SDR family NAD(P)-dependent oxidoreductase, partial [Pseudomonadota bacterium]
MHVVVTGGARGIGAAVCRLLGEARCDVTFGYRADQVAADATVVAARAGGGRAKAVVADVTKEAQIVRLFDTAEAAFGPVTGVVANAGIVAPASTLADMEVERLSQMLEVNVLGAMLTLREAARRMATSRGGQGGTIVTVSSAAARL